MTNWIAPVTCACAIFAFGHLAHAQSTRPQTDSPYVEVIPYVSLGSSASAGIGAGVRWPLASNFSAEIESDYRSGAPNALSANASLLFDLPRVGRATPYLAGGVGLDQYAFAEQSRGELVVQSGTALSVNAGGGLRVPVDQNWGLRTDARWFNGVGKKAPERWRVYNGVTFRRWSR